MVHHSACPLCASERIGLEYKCNDFLVSNTEFAVFRCSTCNFAFTQDSPDEAGIGIFYESESYISHSDSNKGFVNKLYRFSRNIMLKRKRNLIIKISGLENGKLLDIGSGTGYFANAMKEAGWVVKGIEINEKARNYSVSQFGLDVNHPDTISEFDPESFDCITLWHVLEHFQNPDKYLSEIRRILKPGSLCIVAIPNCNSSDALYYKKFWAAWDVPRHLWHFNPATFSLLTKKTGFVLERIKLLPLDVFYISQLSEKNKRTFLPFIKGMLAGIYFSVKSAFNRERCSSLIYILRKPLC